MSWKGWQAEVLECITAHSRATGKLHFSVDDIHSRCGADLEKRAPSRDHIDRTIRASIGSACRSLAKKGKIIKVGATNYQLPGPPPIERFDLPESLDKTAKDALEKISDTDTKGSLLPLVLILLRSVLSLQRRCAALEDKAKTAAASSPEKAVSADTPQPLDVSATLHSSNPGDEPGQSRLPQVAKAAGAVVRSLLDGFTN